MRSAPSTSFEMTIAGVERVGSRSGFFHRVYTGVCAISKYAHARHVNTLTRWYHGLRVFADGEPKWVTFGREIYDLQRFQIATMYEGRERTPSSLTCVANFWDCRPSGTRRSPSSGCTPKSCTTRCLSLRLSELRSGAANRVSTYNEPSEEC